MKYKNNSDGSIVDVVSTAENWYVLNNGSRIESGQFMANYVPINENFNIPVFNQEQSFTEMMNNGFSTIAQSLQPMQYNDQMVSSFRDVPTLEYNEKGLPINSSPQIIDNSNPNKIKPKNTGKSWEDDDFDDIKLNETDPDPKPRNKNIENNVVNQQQFQPIYNPSEAFFKKTKRNYTVKLNLKYDVKIADPLMIDVMNKNFDDDIIEYFTNDFINNQLFKDKDVLFNTVYNAIKDDVEAKTKKKKVKKTKKVVKKVEVKIEDNK